MIRAIQFSLCAAVAVAFAPTGHFARRSTISMADGLKIDMRGKVTSHLYFKYYCVHNLRFLDCFHWWCCGLHRVKIHYDNILIMSYQCLILSSYGWAIAKACAEAGAKILLGTWPPVLPVFQMGIDRGQFLEDQKLSDGSDMVISKVNDKISWYYLFLIYIYLLDLPSRCHIRYKGSHPRGGRYLQEISLPVWIQYPGSCRSDQSGLR